MWKVNSCNKAQKNYPCRFKFACPPLEGNLNHEVYHRNIITRKQCEAGCKPAPAKISGLSIALCK